MIGTVAVTALNPGDVIRLEQHQVTGHEGPVGPRRPIDVMVDALPALIDAQHVAMRWRSCPQFPGAQPHLCGVTTYDRNAHALLVMHAAAFLDGAA